MATVNLNETEPETSGGRVVNLNTTEETPPPTRGPRSVSGFLSELGRYLANPPGWSGIKQGVSGAIEGLVSLPGQAAAAPQGWHEWGQRAQQDPIAAIKELGGATGEFTLGMIPGSGWFKEAAETGKVPPFDTLTREVTGAALGYGLPAAGGAVIKRGTRAVVKELPGAGVELHSRAITRADTMGQEVSRGTPAGAMARMGVDDTASAVRGEQIQQGLKNIKEAHEVGEAVKWELPPEYHTGVVTRKAVPGGTGIAANPVMIDNLREMARQRVADWGTLEQVISPTTTSRLSSSGGRSRRGQPTATDRILQKGVQLETGEVLPINVVTPPRQVQGGTWAPESTRARGGSRTYDPNEPGPMPRERLPNEPFVTEQVTSSGKTSRQIIRGLAEGDGPISPAGLISLRKQLGEMHKTGDKSPLAALRKDMDLLDTPEWDAARAYTRENIVPFMDDQPLGQLINKGEPVAVVRELLRPGDASANALRAVEKQTGRQGPTWKALHDEAVAQSIRTPELFSRSGPETLRILFSPEEQVAVQRFISGQELVSRLDGAVGKAGENFNSFGVNGVSKWLEQRERAALRGDADAVRFVQSFEPGELTGYKDRLKDISQNLSAIPSARGAPVGSSQRALWYSLGALMGEMFGLGHMPFGAGGALGVVTTEGISRLLQTGPGRNLVSGAMDIRPNVSPLTKIGGYAAGRSQVPRQDQNRAEEIRALIGR